MWKYNSAAAARGGGGVLDNGGICQVAPEHSPTIYRYGIGFIEYYCSVSRAAVVGTAVNLPIRGEGGSGRGGEIGVTGGREKDSWTETTKEKNTT